MTLRISRGLGWLSASVAMLIVATGIAAVQRSGGPARFRITLPKASRTAATDGRLILIVSKDPSREPRLQTSPNALTSQQMFGMNVDALAPDAPIVMEPTAGYPLDTLAEVPPGDYTVQAVLNVYETFHLADGRTLKLPMDHWEGQQWDRKPGNPYSTPKKVHVEAGSTIDISLDKIMPEMPYPKDSKYVRYVRLQSKMLTKFWGRPIEFGAFVLLPDGYDTHPDARYPLVINPAHFPTGFGEFRDGAESTSDGNGGNGERPSQRGPSQLFQDWTNGKLPRMLIMRFQHATPYYDDSYGINTANMGPYGDAITQELIPFIEEKYRAVGQPWSRMLTGCSTGGWASLGMQIFYPDFYNGEWTGAPSSIDFRASRLVNLYTYSNAFFYDTAWGRVPIPAEGNRGPGNIPPSKRKEDDQIIATMEQQNHYELVLGDHGRGAALFDVRQALYGPVAPDGYPAPIWDKRTGVINKDTVAYWREHSDLSYIVKRDWAKLGPKLTGKIHLAGGSDDQYFVNNGIRYMAEVLEGLKDPGYGGSVEYGDRQIHCYNGGESSRPTSELGQQAFQRQMPVMLERMKKTAPSGADLKSWAYSIRAIASRATEPRPGLASRESTTDREWSLS